MVRSVSMKASTLLGFLEGKDKGYILKNEISPAVKFMKSQMERVGSSAPINLDMDIDSFEVSKKHVKLLCDSYLSSVFDETEIVYITTAMELGDAINFESSSLEEIVSLMSDPVANGPLSRETMQQIYSLLKV